MSSFTCSHGETYFPFGRLSHHKLMKELILASDSNYIQSLPIHSLPLSTHLSDLTGDSEDSVDDIITEEDEMNGIRHPIVPYVERNPSSEITSVYSQLSVNLLKQIFQIQLSAQLVLSSLSFFLEFC